MTDSSKSPHDAPEDVQSPALTGDATIDFAADSAITSINSRLSDRFAIERLHAQGGLGRVSRATDRQLKRPVAVKEIRADRRTDESRRRFINEAEITGQLEHPGIVPIYALEADAAGEPYYVMRFIQGKPLSDAVRDYHSRPTHLAFRELLQRFTNVCQTIAFAHSRGVLHRDLKPANIMLGDFGETLVVDWGLAKKLDGENSSIGTAETNSIPSGDAGEESTVDRQDRVETVGEKFRAEPIPDATLLTEMGQTLGTPAYMAPEQAAGRWDRVGPASDIYALGGVLYVILTGQTAVQAGNAAETLQKVQRGDFPAPRQRQSSVPAPLNAVCLKAMALDPADRYVTAKDMSDEIEHWLADEPVLAYAEPWQARAGRWLRKHRVLAGSLAALLVTALIASTIGLVALEAERSRTEQARQDTDDALQRVTSEEQRAQAALAKETRARQRTLAALNALTNDMLERLLSRQAQIRDEDKDYLRHIQSFYEDFAADTGSDQTSRSISADGHYRVASIRVNLGEFEEAENGYQTAIALYHKLAADYPKELRYHVGLAGCRQNLGQLLRDLGRSAEAEREFAQAISVCDALVGAEPHVSSHRMLLAGCHINLGTVLGNQGKKADEMAEYMRALQLQEKLVADEPKVAKYRSELAAIHSNLGMTIKSQHKYVEALRHFQSAVDLRKKLVADFPTVAEYRSDLATTQTKLANLFREQGRHGEGEPIYRQAIAVQEQLAADFPVVIDYRAELAAAYSNLAGLIREAGRPEECLAWFQKAIDLLEPMLAQDQNLLVARKYLRVCFWGRALTFDQLLRRDEALRDWDRAVELSTDVEKPQMQMPRAASLAGAGRHQEAIAEANRLIQGASAGVTYDAACVHALASASAQQDAQLHEQYAARAVELLHQAKEGGLFRNSAMVDYLRTDNDLKPLRERDDFKKLIVELEAGVSNKKTK